MLMLIEMLRALRAACYKQELHYCSACPIHLPGLKPILIRWYEIGDNRATLLLRCPDHGNSYHEAHRFDCWCVK